LLIDHLQGRLPSGGRIGGTGNLAAATLTEAEEDDEAIQKQVHHDVDLYIRKLQSWEKDARMKVGLLKKENILEAFENEDAADPPGLRLYWEYLECVGWDKVFYNKMVQELLSSASR
jgi:hypothetical protein